MLITFKDPLFNTKSGSLGLSYVLGDMQIV